MLTPTHSLFVLPPVGSHYRPLTILLHIYHCHVYTSAVALNFDSVVLLSASSSILNACGACFAFYVALGCKRELYSCNFLWFIFTFFLTKQLFCDSGKLSYQLSFCESFFFPIFAPQCSILNSFVDVNSTCLQFFFMTPND